MKHYSFLLVFVSLLLFCACGNKTDSPTSSMTSTDLSRMDRVEIKDQRKIMVDSIVEKINYVKLGKTGDVLIGKVTDLLITPDHIIVGDARQAKAVFIFDRAGKLTSGYQSIRTRPSRIYGFKYNFPHPRPTNDRNCR